LARSPREAKCLDCVTTGGPVGVRNSVPRLSPTVGSEKAGPC